MKLDYGTFKDIEKEKRGIAWNLEAVCLFFRSCVRTRGGSGNTEDRMKETEHSHLHRRLSIGNSTLQKALISIVLQLYDEESEQLL